MKLFNPTRVGAIVITLLFSATFPAMAEETMYPGSNCDIDLPREAIGGFDKQNAAMNVDSFLFTAIICPIPIKVPRTLQVSQTARAVTYRVAVFISDGGVFGATGCRIERVTTSQSVIDTPFQETSGTGTRSVLVFRNVTLSLPVRERVILRCRVSPDVKLHGYSVSTTNF